MRRLEALVRHRGVDADAQGRLLAACRLLQPLKSRTGPLERALQAARLVVHLAGAVDRYADVLEKPGGREIRQRFRPLVADDCPVGRQVAAGIPLFAKEIEDGHDVLPHEDLSARQTHLETGIVRERLTQRVERHLPAPLAFDVQQVADVAELAVQVAPHRGFVHSSHGQPIRAARLLVDETADAPLVASAAISRPGVTRQRQRTRPYRDRLPQPRDRRTQGPTTRAGSCRVVGNV